MKKKKFYMIFWGAIISSFITLAFIQYLFSEQLISSPVAICLIIVEMIIFGYFIYRKPPKEE